MNLSQHFLLHEFARSSMAARMGRDIVVPVDVIPRLRVLCTEVLEPLRIDMGRPIFVLSGYRPEWLNKAVGGSLASQHMSGEAADFVMAGFRPIDVCRRIIALDLPFDQLILEFDQWVHVSFSTRHRQQVITARKIEGKTTYLSGIVEVQS